MLCLKNREGAKQVEGCFCPNKLPLSYHPHFLLFSSHGITKVSHNLQIVFLINCLTHWCIFMMQNTIWEKKILHWCCCNPVVLFGVLIMSDSSIIMTEILFLAISLHPYLITSGDSVHKVSNFQVGFLLIHQQLGHKFCRHSLQWLDLLLKLYELILFIIISMTISLMDI